MKILLETDRLLLRELSEEDVEGMFELDSDPEVHRYLGNKPLKDVNEVRKVIQFVQQQYIDNGIGRWAVIEKETNLFIGWSGLKWMKDPINGHSEYYDLGYRLIRKYWGKGYATESAVNLLRYGFENLKVKEIYAIANVQNLSSVKVLEKSGMKFKDVFIYEDIPHKWFELTQVEWAENRNG